MKERIIDSAIAQISKYGFRRFSISDITSDLGISSKTVYKYFEGKEDLISAVCIKLIEAEKEKVLGIMSSETNWQDKVLVLSCHKPLLGDQLIHELKKHFPDEWEKAIGMKNFLSQHLMEFLQLGVDSGDLRSDINLVVLNIILNSAIDALLKAELKDISQEQVFQEFKKVISFGVLTPESKLRER